MRDPRFCYTTVAVLLTLVTNWSVFLSFVMFFSMWWLVWVALKGLGI